MPRDSQRVFIGNIAPSTRPRELEDFFRGFGKIGDISVKNGYAFLDFDDVRYVHTYYILNTPVLFGT